MNRSCEMQQEYDRLKIEMQRAEDDAQQNMNKRRGIAQEKREAKMERDEAEKYQQMKDDLNECDENVSTRQKALKKAQRDSHKLEKEVSDKEKDISKQRPLFVQAKQELIHVKAKLDTANKTLVAALKQAEKNDEQIKALEKSAKDLENKKIQCEAELASQSQEMELNLSEEQINNYVSLKRAAGKKSGIIDMQLNSMRQDHETDKSALLHEERRMKTWQEKIKSKEQEIELSKKRINQLADTAEQQKSLLQDENTNLVHLEKQVKDSKEKLEKQFFLLFVCLTGLFFYVSNELNEVMKQLSDASGDTAEGERVRRRNEAIDNLRRVFPDKL
uniref:Myosin_tail_1 domain-containing protein n=1 Tax=Heterorhabditis bacteriophora TaxID=37862 RepID=A0A1I7XL48_HETBA